ncbi:hypothetical protein Vi05172_g326 [Venturia inaequalis]|uniref:Uncharacterized protein n=1 Tax=Venturia inaequalis TaxID=5025 RepID=A0A8H3UPJ2_VENIN|nr:hypothetical protein EG327_008787 [Venturia inaequalis]RDI89367.1 hypothetical protein Vi05172_g326 [Venturia inaequalis]
MNHELESYSTDLSPSYLFDDDKPSTLYALLPKLVRSRLRRLPSIRRSVHHYSRSYGAASDASRRSSTEFRTPPPGYTSRVSLSEPVSDSEDLEDEVSPSSSSSNSKGEDSKGSLIKWSFANQGLSLLKIAAQEESIRSARRHSSSALSLSRQLYVHGLTYLLRGLPTNMTPEEKISLWAAVPQDVLDLAQVNNNSKEVVRAAEKRLAEQNGEEPPSFLHRALATFIVQMFLLFQFLIPYINIFAAAAYKYERQNRISERVFASSVNTMDGVMKSTVRLGNSVCQMNDGKVGQALNDLVCWWIRGITGGVHSGVQEGLVVLGIDRPYKQEGGAKH